MLFHGLRSIICGIFSEYGMKLEMFYSGGVSPELRLGVIEQKIFFV